MENDKMFDLMSKMYSEMQQGFKEVRNEITDIKLDLSDVKSELNDVKRTVINIEHNHGQKLEALFDGHTQHSQQLDRIEKEVVTHEEFILKRIQ